MEINEFGTLKQIVSSLERQKLFDALSARKWNATRASMDLGISYRSMRYRMDILGLRRDPAPRGSELGNKWPKLRYSALKRYGNRCHCCGSRPSSGITLCVDHIKPRNKYPHLAMDINNLQILCERCHQSKGANDETDWRK